VCSSDLSGSEHTKGATMMEPRNKDTGGFAGKSTLTSQMPVQRKESGAGLGTPGKTTLTESLPAASPQTATGEPRGAAAPVAEAQAAAAGAHASEQGADAAGAAPKAKKFAPGAPKDFATAQDRHRANLALLKSMLDEGKDQKDSKWGKAYPNPVNGCSRARPCCTR